MPSRINGGRASLQQEVDFDFVNRCPQKGRHATGTRRRKKLSPPEQSTPRLDTVCSNDLRDLDGKYKLKLCEMMVQTRVQMPRTGPEMSSYPRLESHDGRSNSGDRQMSRYEDADWFKENPNRAVGREISRTGTTCADYCPYIKGISVNDWAVSNRPGRSVSSSVTEPCAGGPFSRYAGGRKYIRCVYATIGLHTDPAIHL